MNKIFILILILTANFNTQNFAAQASVDQEFIATKNARHQLAILVAKQMTFDSKPASFQLPTPDFDEEYENDMQESNEEYEEEEKKKKNQPLYKLKAISVKKLIQDEKNHSAKSKPEPVKQFECNKCEKSYAGRAGLFKHMEKKHQKVSNFTCHCGKKFYDKSHFNEHEQRHTEQKPFVCVCKAAFPRKSDLTRHQKTKSHLKIVGLYTALTNKSRPLRPKPY